MFGKEGTIEKEKIYVKEFIRMMCILLMVQKTDAKSCSAHVCLTWKTQNSSLVLICKVEVEYALHLPVSFIGPFKEELGACVPHAPCYWTTVPAVIEKINISDTLNEFIFTTPFKTQLNGLWTCEYGHNNERAITEVYINLSADTGNQFSIDCWKQNMLWCAFGFACSCLLTRLLVFILTFCKSNLEYEISLKVKKYIFCGKEDCNCISNNCPDSARKYIIAFILSSTLFLLPVLVGLKEGKQCKVVQFFACYGAIVGIFSSILFINKEEEKSGSSIQDVEEGEEDSAHYHEENMEEEKSGSSIQNVEEGEEDSAHYHEENMENIIVEEGKSGSSFEGGEEDSAHNHEENIEHEDKIDNKKGNTKEPESYEMGCLDQKRTKGKQDKKSADDNKGNYRSVNSNDTESE